MSIKLIGFLILFCIIFCIFIYLNISNKKISLQHSLMWMFYALLMIIALSTPNDILLKIANFLGINVVSNMIFFFGFIFLLIITFNLTKIISNQKEKITLLAQEIGILKKEAENKK